MRHNRPLGAPRRPPGYVTSAEVRLVLRGIAYCTIRVLDKDAAWNEAVCAEVTHRLSNGWEIDVYVDGCQFDYIDAVRTPTGRAGEFDDWWGKDRRSRPPEHLLHPTELQNVVRAFDAAPVRVD